MDIVCRSRLTRGLMYIFIVNTFYYIHKGAALVCGQNDVLYNVNCLRILWSYSSMRRLMTNLEYVHCTGTYSIQIMNGYECDGTDIFMR